MSWPRPRSFFKGLVGKIWVRVDQQIGSPSWCDKRRVDDLEGIYRLPAVPIPSICQQKQHTCWSNWVKRTWFRQLERLLSLSARYQVWRKLRQSSSHNWKPQNPKTPWSHFVKINKNNLFVKKVKVNRLGFCVLTCNDQRLEPLIWFPLTSSRLLRHAALGSDWLEDSTMEREPRPYSYTSLSVFLISVSPSAADANRSTVSFILELSSSSLLPEP